MKIQNLFLSLVAAVGFVLSLSTAAAAPWPAARPKLVVLIVIDQFRGDYLSRFGDKFVKDGFRGLMNQGAYFPYGEYDILHSMTGPGHATVLSGSYPYQMGIPLNDWYDVTKKKSVYCVEDAEFGRSPRNFVGTTVGDEVKNAGLQGRMVSLALKDRAAILMGGHRADSVMWFDDESKKWTSSKYYLKTNPLPLWTDKMNADPLLAKCDLSTTCGTEITLKAAETTVRELKLGQGKGVDIFSVSFSSHDFAGHKHGANSPQMEVMTLGEDKAIASLRKTIAAVVPGGLKNVTFVLTGDHGVSPSAEYLMNTGIDSGNISEKDLQSSFEDSLTKLCGKPKNGNWINATMEFNFFIDEASADESKCGFAKIQSEIKNYLLKDPRFAQAFTLDEYESRKLPPGQFGRQADKTYYRGRSGHVIGIPKPFYVNSSKNVATHITGYGYDRTVPILFSGHGVKPGLYAEKAEVVDIAPTLSFMIGVLPPALSEGKVLKSALVT
ncbi:MAG: alkaline phosphatase family protein, partial [Bdellovibrionaceae bacterium]|nr:alkaline phosphatase family protein [Pseudobdellovibrionaceae bacterium]